MHCAKKVVDKLCAKCTLPLWHVTLTTGDILCWYFCVIAASAAAAAAAAATRIDIASSGCVAAAVVVAKHVKICRNILWHENTNDTI